MFDPSGSILTITLNAAVDKAYTVPGFTLGRINRPAALRVTAGGKGVNVARVFQTLGGSVVATGFLAGRNGGIISEALADEGIESQFVRVSGESRVCAAVMDPCAGVVTELNECGPSVTEDDCHALLTKLRELLPAHAAVIISGSIPPGGPVCLYADIIRLAQEEFGVPAMLDASGEPLLHGVQARPYLVKPNECEVGALDVGDGDLIDCAKALRDRYSIALALVTAGAQGAVLASEDGIWEARPPTIRVVSAVGSGDSLAAGFAWSILQGHSLPESLKIGVATGAANAETASAGFVTRERVYDLADCTVVTQIS